MSVNKEDHTVICKGDTIAIGRYYIPSFYFPFYGAKIILQISNLTQDITQKF